MNRGINRLENIKRDELCYFSDYEWFPNWENFLTFDYWKDWRNKIPLFQSEEELIFYAQRLHEVAELIRSSKKYGVKEGENADLLIKKEEIRLQNISQEDWKKEYKTLNVEFKELSVEEMLNDPWFREQLGFGSENKRDEKRLENKENQEEKPKKENDNGNADYKNWTKDQLISEINLLKAENEELKNNKSLTNSEKENIIRQNQEKLDKLDSYYRADLQTNSPSSNNSNNNFPTGWIISGTILLAIGGLLTLLIYKNKKIKK